MSNEENVKTGIKNKAMNIPVDWESFGTHPVRQLPTDWCAKETKTFYLVKISLLESSVERREGQIAIIKAKKKDVIHEFQKSYSMNTESRPEL